MGSLWDYLTYLKNGEYRAAFVLGRDDNNAYPEYAVSVSYGGRGTVWSPSDTHTATILTGKITPATPRVGIPGGAPPSNPWPDYYGCGLCRANMMYFTVAGCVDPNPQNTCEPQDVGA